MFTHQPAERFAQDYSCVLRYFISSLLNTVLPPQVGADGPNSPVRKFAGIESYGWAYDTRAIVATLHHAPRVEGLQKPNTTAYQRFLPTGPIAFLPLSQAASSFVWSTKPAIAEALTSLDGQSLAHMINAAFRLPEVSLRHLYRVIMEEKPKITPEVILEEIRWRERSHNIDQYSAYSSHATEALGVPANDAELVPPVVKSIQEGTVASFPLRLSHADSYIGEDERGARIALLGDAAHTTHPLAGQGLNMGLGDAQALAKAINDAVLAGGDIGKSEQFISKCVLIRRLQGRERLCCLTHARATSRTTSCYQSWTSFINYMAQRYHLWSGHVQSDSRWLTSSMCSRRQSCCRLEAIQGR